MTARRDRALSVVKPGAEPAKKAAPKKRAAARPRTVAHAAKLSKRTLLETVRDKIAASMDDPRAHPRDVMAGAKQLLDIQAQIDALSGRAAKTTTTPEQQAGIASTPHEPWDESAV